MKGFSISVILDTIFISFLGFTSCFLIFNYFFERKIAIGFSITLALVLLIFTFGILKAKRKKNKLAKKEKVQAENTLLQLSFMPKAEAVALIHTALEKENLNPIKTRFGFSLPDKKALIFLSLNLEGTTKSDVVKAFNKLDEEHTVIYIFSTSVSGEVLEFTKRFNGKVKIIFGEKIYSLLKKHNALPPEKYRLLFKKSKFYFSNILKRKKAKRYASLGFCMAFFSFLVSFKLYYVIFACLFFTLSIITFIFGKKDSENAAST